MTHGAAERLVSRRRCEGAPAGAKRAQICVKKKKKKAPSGNEGVNAKLVGGFAWGRGPLRIICVRACVRERAWLDGVGFSPPNLRASSLGSQQQPRAHHHQRPPPPPPLHLHLLHHSRGCRGNLLEGGINNNNNKIKKKR